MSIDLTKIKRVRTPDGREWGCFTTSNDNLFGVNGFGGDRGDAFFYNQEIKILIESGAFTPIAEPIEIPLEDWEPQEGDIVEWANGFVGKVFVADAVKGRMLVEMPCGFPAVSNSTNLEVAVPIIQAAKCKIWRNQ